MDEIKLQAEFAEASRTSALVLASGWIIAGGLAISAIVLFATGARVHWPKEAAAAIAPVKRDYSHGADALYVDWTNCTTAEEANAELTRAASEAWVKAGKGPWRGSVAFLGYADIYRLIHPQNEVRRGRLGEILRIENADSTNDGDGLVARLGEDVLEIGRRRDVEARELVTVCYEMERFFRAEDTGVLARRTRASQLLNFITTHVSPADWSLQGGELGIIEILDDTCFVTAPPRLQDGVADLFAQMKDIRGQSLLEAGRVLTERVGDALAQPPPPGAPRPVVCP